MTHAPATWEQALAWLRTAAQAERETCVRRPAALEAMLLALLLRLLAALGGAARWPGAPARALRPALSRSRARIASGRVPPRAARRELFLDWWLRMNFGRGMRPAAPPPGLARPRLLRAPPPEPARA
jgi:hypothetical protein